MIDPTNAWWEQDLRVPTDPEIHPELHTKNWLTSFGRAWGKAARGMIEGLRPIILIMDELNRSSAGTHDSGSCMDFRGYDNNSPTRKMGPRAPVKIYPTSRRPDHHVPVRHSINLDRRPRRLYRR